MGIKQFILTVSAGKRLIAKGVVEHPAVKAALRQGKLVIIAGSTNGYVAEEILGRLGQLKGFSREGFRRGFVAPPGFQGASDHKLQGDVILTNGVWREQDRSKTVFDVAAGLAAGDVVLKGGNALDLADRRAGALIGHPEAGSIGAVLPAVFGRRTRVIVPIGLEKRVDQSVYKLADELNSPDAEGPRMLPLPGEVFTEIEAIALLTGAQACLAAAGGIYGAEGAVWLAVKGDDQQLLAAGKLLVSVAEEPPTRV